MLSTFVEYGYAGVFAALIASGFGFPIPEELPVLTAGVLCGHADTLADGATELAPGRLRWFIMLPVVILGVVLGDGVLYGIGRLWGPRLLANPWVLRKVPREKQEKIEKEFHDRGVMILLTARVTPGIRSPIFLMAGVLRVPIGRFLFADGIYAIPGVSIMFTIAYFLTDQVLEIFKRVDQYRPVIVVGVLSAIAGVLAYRFITSRRVATGSVADVPLIDRPIEIAAEAATHAVEKTVGVAKHAVEATVTAATHAVEKTIEAVTHRNPGEKPEPVAEANSGEPAK